MAANRRPAADTPAIKQDRLREARRDYYHREHRKATKEERATAERQRLLMSWHGSEFDPQASWLSALDDKSREDFARSAALRRGYEQTEHRTSQRGSNTSR